ncbi:MAG: ribbon-helix-helix domain-containing protein [Bifidobacteriaceae bacterium]|jgi:hypothetical protein|nr:ribbon-helix-helix domain-containing protein [Bifidobacteriaceae bacterium]
MRKTTVYLDDQLAEGLERAARLTGTAQAEIMRRGARKEVESALAARPKMTALPAKLGGDWTQERIDAAMAGFGE